MAAERNWRHMPQLDGLRALAVLAVLVAHFGLGPHLEAVVAGVDWGHLGVRLFFVLSGFLITGLLFERRLAVEAGAQSASSAFGRFYARRFLRIFPVFYATLLVGAAVDVGNLRDVLVRHALYLSNLDTTLYAVGEDGLGRLRDASSAHFWSLSVEEQFYFFWPAVILLIPSRSLVKVLVAIVVVSPLWRAAWFLAGSRSPSLHLPACFDTLGVGALLALYRHDFGGVRAFLRPRLRWLLMGGAALLVAVCVAHARNVLYRPRNVLIDVGEAIVFAVVVARAAGNHPGPFGRLLCARPLQYIGKISYGVYVFHAFMAPLQLWAFERLGLPPLGDTLGRAALLTAMTIAAASLSWHLFESPINKLKSLVPRDAPVPAPAAASTNAPPA